MSALSNVWQGLDMKDNGHHNRGSGKSASASIGNRAQYGRFQVSLFGQSNLPFLHALTLVLTCKETDNGSPVSCSCA